MRCVGAIGTLRNLSRVTNQFLESFGVLVAFLSLKQDKNKGEFCAIHDNAS